jgi:hypothetical protein
MRLAILVAAVGISCGQSQPDGTMPDPPQAPVDLGPPLAPPAPYVAPQGSAWAPPSGSRAAVAHAKPSPVPTSASLLAGKDILDVSTDGGGGVWAVTASNVYYFPPGKTTPVAYDQSDGLARGWLTWQDTYFNGTPDQPSTQPVTFSAVAGATPGQAVVGNIGAIADRLVVDPKSGAIQKIENLKVNPNSTSDADTPYHSVRVVATHKVIANLHGNRNGTAYLGGWHGFYALHGLNGDCACSSDFEEHKHYVPPSGCDSSGAELGCWDGDVWGLAFSPEGDVWAGDRHFVQLLPQGSLGSSAGLTDADFKVGIDVFPGVRDEVHGLAVDGAGGVWVASDGNGLAYLQPGSWTPTYWSMATTLPLDYLHGAVIDREGDLWVGTDGAGVARYHADGNRWTYYTQASGLPDDRINTLYLDPSAGTSRIYIATRGGVAVVEPR